MAGGEIASAYLSIYPKLEGKAVISEITKSMADAGTSAGKALSDSASSSASSGMRGAGSSGASAFSEGFSAVKVAIGNIISNVATSAANEFKERFSDGIEQSDMMQKFASTMEFAGFATDQIEAVRSSMKGYADQTVYDLGEVMDTTAKLAANGVDDFESLVQAAGNLNAAAGGNSESFGAFANAITQVNGAGLLMTQDWNQVINALPGASGAIQNELKEMGAWDDSMGTFKDALSAGEVTADEFNQALKNLGMTDVAKEAATSTTTFEGAMGQLDAAITNTMQGIYDSLNKDGRITDFINSMASAFEGAQPVIEAVATAFGDFIQWIAPALPIIAGIAAGIAAVSVLGSVISAIGGAIAFVTGVIGPAIAAIGSIQGAIAVVTTVLGGPIVVIAAIVGAIVAWLATNEKARAKVVEVFNKIKSAISTALNAAKAVVTSVMSAIKSTISNAMGAAKSAVSNAGNSIKSIWTGAMNALVSVVSSAVSRVSSAFNNIRSAVTSVFGGAASWLYSAGQNIIQGLVNGIRGAVGWVTSAVSSVCSNALSTLKSFFGIKSPSRLMAEMGDYMMLGLAEGIDAGTGAAVYAMEGASAAVAGALGSGSALYTYGSNVGTVETNLVDEIRALRADVQSMHIYLDSGALVGGISRQMDSSLGRRQQYAGRGVV